ncbi:MAG: type II pantothenate kinase [Clostridia bacterium]|nr:type II pantothenate kinase [Clostridia bacterium]
MKNTIIGIDVGGSTTKIVGFTHVGDSRELISPLFVKAGDPITSLYGAFGRFLNDNSLSLDDIECVKVTGVGSSYLNKPIYDLRCDNVSEFESIGRGGLYISGLEEAIIVSMGTGTALVHAKKDGAMTYLGGTGVGGGTLVGLSKLLLGMNDVSHIEQLAEQGDVGKVDLKIKDLSDTGRFTDMSAELTASNFGKVSDLAGKEDVAAGIINTVFETIAMLAVFAARGHKVRDIVLTGNMTTLATCHKVFDDMSRLFDVNFIIPEHSQFATVIGAALQK